MLAVGRVNSCPLQLTPNPTIVGSLLAAFTSVGKDPGARDRSALGDGLAAIDLHARASGARVSISTYLRFSIFAAGSLSAKLGDAARANASG